MHPSTSIDPLVTQWGILFHHKCQWQNVRRFWHDETLSPKSTDRAEEGHPVAVQSPQSSDHLSGTLPVPPNNNYVQLSAWCNLHRRNPQNFAPGATCRSRLWTTPVGSSPMTSAPISKAVDQSPKKTPTNSSAVLVRYKQVLKSVRWTLLRLSMT